MTTSKRPLIPVLLAIALASGALPARVVYASEELERLRRSVETLQRQLDEVQTQLKAQEETMRAQEAKAASKQAVRALKKEVEQASADSSEWKNVDSVVHLAGYGSVSYEDGSNENAAFKGVSFNPIFHYQYKDLMLLESELEVEIEEDGSTNTGLEYMTLDLFINDYMAVIGGKFLSPLGYFRQNLHPAWVNKLPNVPSGFGHDEAAPVSELGAQLRGGFPVGGRPMYVNYSAYVGNGPILEINDAEGVIEAVESEGRTSDPDSRKVWGGRIGFLPIPMLELGLSGALGRVAGADEESLRRDYNVYGADLAYKWRSRLALRAEYIKQHVGSRSASVAPGSADWSSWYAQAAYRFLPWDVEGVVRYSDYNGNLDEQDQKQWALGINYLFASNVIAKFAYDFNDGKSGSDANDNGFQIQMAYGF